MNQSTKPSFLPDISLSESAPRHSALTWVGMQGIDLPLTVDEPGCSRELHACADVQVNLPAPHIKGIHMSRLYRLLDAMGNGQGLTAAGIHQVLKAMMESHADCQSENARLQLNFNLLLRRPALVTEGLAHVVDDHRHPQAFAVGQHMVEQGGFARTQKAGEHGDGQACVVWHGEYG